jgi:hypothetical protein
MGGKMMKQALGLAFAISLAMLAGTDVARAQQSDMTFFISSSGSGKGADLGGLEGADRLCRTLATAAGSSGKTWHAYLSTQGANAVNARDRIGKGPWQNAKAVVIAKSVEDLHGPNNNISKETALTEKGATVNGRGDQPNMHDILTGSQPDGTAFAGDKDQTCGNYTKSGADGAVMLGHHDRRGLSEDPPAKSWNSSHPSRGGCSQDALKGTGSAGLIYCFAAN